MSKFDLARTVARMPLLNGLPMLAGAARFLDLLANNQVVIVKAETGSGKSTGLPPILLEAGYSMLQTQPRALAARTVSARIAEIVGTNLGEVVGYRTAAVKDMDSRHTRCLVVTDGLAMVRRIMRQERAFDILMLDEVHEWNTNIEVLVGWVKRQLAAGAKFKVVLMSATLEAERLSEYFGGAPILDLPGKIFPIEEQPAGASVEADAARLLNEGRNVLIFQPGKKEIEKSIDELSRLVRGKVMILPLHAQLSAEEQKRCFAGYNVPKCVVATNVAQTSVTIPDIDAVVDTGMENRLEVNDGVEGLQLAAISMACRAQRKGRAGRTKPGIYIDHGPFGRPDFPVAEIQRTRLDQTVLRLMRSGVDLEDLELFHQPEISKIREAKRVLVALGCLDEEHNITELGEQVGQWPSSVEAAVLVIEAAKRGVLDDGLTIAAIIEQGGLIVRESPGWMSLAGGERQSDCLAQLNVFKNIHGKRYSADELRALGIHVGAYRKVVEGRKKLEEAASRHYKLGSSGNREEIVKSICASMSAHIFAGTTNNLLGADGNVRQLARESIVSATGQVFIVGRPFDIKRFRLVTMATCVEFSLLAEVAPHLLKEQVGVEPRFDEHKDCVVAKNRKMFGALSLAEEEVDAPEHDAAAEVFARWCADRMAA